MTAAVMPAITAITATITINRKSHRTIMTTSSTATAAATTFAQSGNRAIGLFVGLAMTPLCPVSAIDLVTDAKLSVAIDMVESGMVLLSVNRPEFFRNSTLSV
jgi:hypothetical protein